MEGMVAALWIGAALVMVCSVQCNEDIVSVISRMDDLNKDVIRVEERVLHQIDSAKISLRSELKQHISEHVREAIAGILHGESIEEMMRNQVITEVRQLRRGNDQMKRQFHRVLMSLNEVRQDQRLCCETLQKTDIYTDGNNVCSQCVRDVKILKSDLERCESASSYYRQQAAQKDKEITELKQSLNMLNQTFQSQLKEINTAYTSVQTSTASPTTSIESTTIARTAATTASFTTASKPEEESRTTISKPEERSRIIIAPRWSGTPYQFRQMDIHKSTVSPYPLRGLKNVMSVAYVSKLRKLLISLFSPNKIVASNLDSYDIKLVRGNIKSLDITVDEERETVFMTSDIPHKTISRMTTRGKRFTVVKYLSKYGSWPYAIAINSKERKIFICNVYKLLMVTYDGGVTQTLAKGSSMYSLTLDDTGDILYYNNGKKLMKMSLSQNVSEIVTILSVTPWNIRYYMHSLYFSSRGSKTIRTVNVRYDIVPYTLQTIEDFNTQIICLVP